MRSSLKVSSFCLHNNSGSGWNRRRLCQEKRISVLQIFSLDKDNKRAYQSRAEANKQKADELGGKLTESIATSDSSGIIKMYRSKGPHRKIASDGSHIIDKATYHRITNPAKKKGADIRLADNEVELTQAQLDSYLDEMQMMKARGEWDD